MGKINWKIRFQNKVWVSGLISQTLIVIQTILFGLNGLGAIHLDMNKAHDWANWGLGLADIILAYLAYLGIVVDPTVEGVGDSARALQRDEPLPEEQKGSINS